MIMQSSSPVDAIAADQQPEQLLLAIAQAVSFDEPVMLADANDDQYTLAAYYFAQYGFRCVGQTTNPTVHQFVRLAADKQHIVVAATNDNFHFLEPAIALMREQGHFVSKLSCHGLNAQTLLSSLKFCDIAWFEWGDSAVITASQLPKYCRIVCRIHRYELYGTAFQQANWENVDEVIFVSQAMKKRFISLMGNKLPQSLQVTVLANLTDHVPQSIESRQRDPYALACVARFCAQKNLVMLLPIMQALVKKNSRYKLYIAGRVEDQCLYDSFCQLIEVYGLKSNIIICGTLPADEMSAWYSTKSFFLSVSYNESQGMAIFEAMLAGLKPVAFHAVGGLDEYLPSRYLFTDFGEAVVSITDGDIHPESYILEAKNILRQETLRLDYSRIWQENQNSSALISIVIPCYNRERYLLAAVCSALNQRDSHFEVIVVDDGSTDSSLDCIAHITDPRLRVIPKEHTNAPDTRNRCIAESRGEYLVWLDSDDLLHANALHRYRTLLQRWPQLDIISCGLETLSGEKKFYSLVNLPPANKLSQLAYGNFVSNPGCCVRRALYIKVGNYNTDYLRAHDYEFWSRAIGVAQIAFTAQCHISYRLHSDNLTGFGKPVDSTYEYRIFDSIIQRYNKKVLFPGRDNKVIDKYIAVRRAELLQECYLDNLLIIVNAINKPIKTPISQIKALGLQCDRKFETLIVSDKMQPLPGQEVIMTERFSPSVIREYVDKKHPDKYFRAFVLNDNAQEHQLSIRELKQAILCNSPIPSHFCRIDF